MSDTMTAPTRTDYGVQMIETTRPRTHSHTVALIFAVLIGVGMGLILAALTSEPAATQPTGRTFTVTQMDAPCPVKRDAAGNCPEATLYWVWAKEDATDIETRLQVELEVYNTTKVGDTLTIGSKED